MSRLGGWGRGVRLMLEGVYVREIEGGTFFFSYLTRLHLAHISHASCFLSLTGSFLYCCSLFAFVFSFFLVRTCLPEIPSASFSEGRITSSFGSSAWR